MKPAMDCGELEADWIHQAQQGNRRAYSELVQMHREGVVGMVYHMCGDAQLAEDVAQDTFIRAWQHLPHYKPRSSLRNWLLRIAANRALDILRRERDKIDIDEFEQPGKEIAPELQAIQNERQKAVQQAVLSLPLASRSVLILREYEDLSYKEISETLDIPLGTVMSRLNFARNKLKQSLHQYLEAA